MVLGKQDQVVRPHFLGIAARKQRIDTVDCGDAMHLLHVGNVAAENGGEHRGIVAGAVMMEIAEIQMIGHRIQLMVFEIRVQRAAYRHRIDRAERIRHAAARRCRFDK